MTIEEFVQNEKRRLQSFNKADFDGGEFDVKDIDDEEQAQ